MNEKLTAARQAETAGDYVHAIQLMNEAISMGPHEAILWLELGKSQSGAGQFDFAAASYARAAKENASSPKPNLAIAKTAESHFAESLSHLSRGVEDRPSDKFESHAQAGIGIGGNQPAIKADKLEPDSQQSVRVKAARAELEAANRLLAARLAEEAAASRQAQLETEAENATPQFRQNTVQSGSSAGGFLGALTTALGAAATQAQTQNNSIQDALNRGLAQTAAIQRQGQVLAAQRQAQAEAAAAAQRRLQAAAAQHQAQMATQQQASTAIPTVRNSQGSSSQCSHLAKDCVEPISNTVSAPAVSRPAPAAPPAQTLALRNAPIVPDPIYAATPASGVCPPSGYYMSQTGDVSVGIPCSPGKPLPASGSQGSAPPSTGGSGNAGQSGTNGNPHHLISPRGDLQQCVTFDFNGQTSLRGQLGWDRYSNTCQQAVNVTVVFQDGQGGASEMDIDAGKTGGLAKNRKEYADHGGSSYYVCPAGYGAADVQGNYLYKTRVTQYMCRQHGW